MKANHLYDTWHFNRDIQTASTQNRDQFMNDMRKAVFKMFPINEENF